MIILKTQRPFLINKQNLRTSKLFNPLNFVRKARGKETREKKMDLYHNG